MRNIRRGVTAILAAVLVWLAATSYTVAQKSSLDDLITAVVRVKTVIHPEGRTVQSLARERDGSGIVIDSNGLVLTIGYLMVEAYAAEIVTNDGRRVPANIVGYDHDSGFGLLQATAPLNVKPIPMGKSGDVKQGDPVVVAGAGGRDNASAAIVVAKREFAGYWEYLLDEAFFTSPPLVPWSGAALIGRDGKLVGVGSLIVPDATGKGDGVVGNMFVPIDRLPPILADLMADGRVSGPAKPWIGVTTNEARGRLSVAQVTPGGPADKAGLRQGDVITGVAGETPAGLADFYRKIWARGAAGATVPIEIERGGDKRRLDVQSINRLDHLKLKGTF
jgi:S1-C subfamily serine protease